MNAIDFDYDGRFLSDYGFIICDFNGSSGADAISVGSTLTFNTVSRFGGKMHSLTNSEYTECLTTTFDICKNPEYHDEEEMVITGDEFRFLMRWLNRKEFLPLQLYDSDANSEVYCFEASFNIQKIKIHENTYGLRLTMETNKPFAYSEEYYVKWTFINSNDSKTLEDYSDEVGYIYPSLKIVCGSNGDFILNNDLYNCSMEIKNCTDGEIIEVNGSTFVISSSVITHNVAEDFNYDFFKIGNTIDNRYNHISVSMPCTIELCYNPIIKDIL